MTVSRPVLRYHGGKFGSMGTLADWIIAHFPEHRVYVEPFGGAASVLLRKPRAYLEVYNDLWDEVVNVFAVLREPSQAAELREALRLTPFARREWEIAQHPEGHRVERARRAIVRSYMGYGSASINSAHRTGFRAAAMRQNTPAAAADWANYPDAIPGFIERLRGVVIENRDALDLMPAHDSPHTLFYVDPPYLTETRSPESNTAYAHEYAVQDHERLAEILRQLQGMVVLSGYEHPLYERLYGDWHQVRKHTRADGADPARRERVECLWLNPAAAAGLRQRDLFAEAEA